MSKQVNNKIHDLLNELTKEAIKRAVDISYCNSKEELMDRFINLINTPDDENNPGPFALMQAVGLTGMVLASRYNVDEKALMELVKDSNVNFIREIKND